MDLSKKLDQLPDAANATFGQTEPAVPLKVLAAGSLEAGDHIAGYTILGKLGVGGMGVVYKAHDTALERTVALKLLPPHLFHDSGFLQRFRTEALAQARLNTPNVVTLFQMLEIPAGLVLVMEYVEGETLGQRLREQGPLTVKEAVWVFDQALSGVESAHAMGIIHRDLKPGNIFITRRGEVKLMDFGIAHIVGHREPGHGGAVVGTLLYIAPEQINGRDADFRSDLYTLGVSLFEAVTGRLPFERRTDYGLMHAHVLEHPPSPRTFQRDLPPELESVILKAIEKDPGRRFQSAAAFRKTLRACVGKAGPDPMPTSTGSASGRPQVTKTPWLPHGRAPLRRLWNTWGFELLLLTTILALALHLGLVPRLDFIPATRRPQPPAEVSVPAHAAAPIKTVVPGPAPSDTAAAAQVHSMPPAIRSARLPSKYNVLRQAWGGS